MTWTDRQWDAFCGLVEEGWAFDFDDKTATIWRAVLDGIPPQAAMKGVRRLLLEGHRYRPSVSEVLAAARRDPSVPTFEEMLALVYGPGGVLRARPTVRRYRDQQERRRLDDQAALDRAASMHPLIASFVARQDLEHLRSLPLVDAGGSDRDRDRAHFARKELRDAWDRHVQTADSRQVAALAAGERGLHRFDPLAALGPVPGVAALPEGEPAP